jgi:hypothetical protein
VSRILTLRLVNLFQKIKHFIRLFFLRRELKKKDRRKQVMGFDESASIGVLFDASDEASWQQTAQFIRQLEAEGKKVRALGFEKHKKAGPHLVEQMNMGFFQRRNFGWNLRRKHPGLQEFENTVFDILIDLSPPGVFHTRFMSALSAARYKVGVFEEEYVEHFDLMMRMPDDYRLQELMQHTVYYLKMIKKPVTHAGKV